MWTILLNDDNENGNILNDERFYHNCHHYQKADISTIVDRLTDTSKYGGTHKVIKRKENFSKAQ